MSTASTEPVAETAKLCELLGITPKDTSELKKIGALAPAAGRGRWMLKASIQAYTGHLRRMNDLKANDAATLNKELIAKKIIKTAAEGALAELRLEEEKGSLVSAREVYESGLRIGQIFTARIESFVAEASGACAGLDERALQRELHRRTQAVLRDIKEQLQRVS